MSNKKVLTFRDYLNAIMKLKKVADDLEDIDKETGVCCPRVLFSMIKMNLGTM